MRTAECLTPPYVNRFSQGTHRRRPISQACVMAVPILPTLAVVGTISTWAASFPAIGYALREIDPLPLASLRFALAALFALAWLLWRRPCGFSGRDFGRVALCGVLGIAAYNILLNSGQAEVSAGAASFIVNTQPLFMALLAVVFLGEVFARWSWLGAMVGFAGVAVIAWGQPGGFTFAPVRASCLALRPALRFTRCYNAVCSITWHRSI